MWPHTFWWRGPSLFHTDPPPRAIRNEMLSVANNYKHIYEMYNFDFDPEPGSVQYKVDQRIKRVRSVGRSGEKCGAQKPA